MSEFVTVTKTGSIPEGRGATFVVGGRLVAVFFVDGQYFAIDDSCPHMGASLGAGEVHEGVVTCPWHAWRFSVCDGIWRDNPKLKVDHFEVRVEGDEVQLRLPADDTTGGPGDKATRGEDTTGGQGDKATRG